MMTTVELEKRLAETEKLLNIALKEIDRLSGLKFKKTDELELISYIDDDVFNELFDFYYDSETGEKCPADEQRKRQNFYNLKNNIFMCLGYHYPAKNSKSNLYNSKVIPNKNIPIEDYPKLRKLFKDITDLMYDYKKASKEK